MSEEIEIKMMSVPEVRPDRYDPKTIEEKWSAAVGQ